MAFFHRILFRKSYYYSPRELVILAGSTTWIPKEKVPTRQISTVKSIHTNDFTIRPTKNDIALLKVKPCFL